jgi:hypothetical protein
VVTSNSESANEHTRVGVAKPQPGPFEQDRSGSNQLRPLPREGKLPEGAEAHQAGDGIVRDGALELERELHRVGNRNLPRYVVAADRAVENLAGMAVVTLRACQRRTRALQVQERVAVAQRRGQDKIPIAVYCHFLGALAVVDNFPQVEARINPTCAATIVPRK